MKKNKNAFSLIIAIGLMTASIMVAYIIIEYMIPFLRNLKGIENSTSSYYLAYSGLEKGLYFFSTRSGNKEGNEILEDFCNDEDTFIDYNRDYCYNYETFSSGAILPEPGKGNSEYGLDYNTISMGNPIQLSVGYGYIADISNLKVFFQVPEIDEMKGRDIIKHENTDTDTNIINWQLSSESQTLNSVTESLVKNSNVNNGEDISLSTKDGRLIDGTPKTFSQFYNENCGAGERCILRFSVINPLKGEKSNIPFLEWQIKIDPPNSSIPLRYSRIVSTGKAYGFSKTLEIRVPQDTIPEALDFTVFQ